MARYVLTIATCLIVSVAFAERITLVKSEAPAATIVLPTAELSSYVKKLSGVGLPIRNDGVLLQGAALVLDDKDAPLPPVTPPKEQHALETFSIRVSDGNVYFGGRSPEAVTYGVLVFIEDNLGVRFYGVATKDWQRLAACVTVPREAETLCVMLGHERAREADVAFDDALLLLAQEAPKPPALEERLADGVFKTQAGGHLSAQYVRNAKGRDGGALAFTAGDKGENSFLKISGIVSKYDLQEGITFD